jgi:hypothetical protein
MGGFYFAGLTTCACEKDFMKLGVIRCSLTMGLLLTMVGTGLKWFFDWRLM